MASLKNRHQVFVVQRLACYATLAEVRGAVKEEFGLEVSRHQVAYYDPTTATGGDPAEKWRTLFEETRAAYAKNTASLAIAQRRWRLEQLEADFRRLRRDDPAAAARLLEQAAKEIGGKYTNEQKHKHAGPGGGPIQTQDVPLSDADLARIASEDEEGE